MPDSRTTLTELICTRISHDLIGNIGAVANAVELLEEGDLDFMEDIRSILKTSSSVLGSRLKFFRMAFGLDNANTADIKTAETVCRDYLRSLGNPENPVILNFQLSDSRYVRVVMPALMVIADMLLRGGCVNVLSGEGKVVVMPAEGTRFSQEKAAKVRELLQSGKFENDARYAPLYYLLSRLPDEGIKMYMADAEIPALVFE